MSLIWPPRYTARCLRLALVAAGMGCLVGCWHSTPAEPSDRDVARAESMRPSNPRWAEQYERACLTCHATRSAAPLTGFQPAWEARLKQGMDTLVQHARDGFKGMPAKGLCADCHDDDLRGLITFMSQNP